MTKLVARKCAYCGRGKGTIAFRYDDHGRPTRNYFHPPCFEKFLSELDGYRTRRAMTEQRIQEWAQKTGRRA